MELAQIERRSGRTRKEYLDEYNKPYRPQQIPSCSDIVVALHLLPGRCLFPDTLFLKQHFQRFKWQTAA